MTRILLIIALLYVLLIHLPRTISRSTSRPKDNAPQSPRRQSHAKEGTTVTRVEEPKPRVLDPADASEAHFEEVDE